MEVDATDGLARGKLSRLVSSTELILVDNWAEELEERVGD